MSTPDFSYEDSARQTTIAQARNAIMSHPAPRLVGPDESVRPDWTDGLLRGQPRRDGTRPILPVLANAICAVQHAPEWGSVLGFDEFAVQAVTLKPTPWSSEPHSWSDTEDILLAEWLQHHGICVSREIAGQAVEAVSRANVFHPVRDYLDAQQWDGTARLATWTQRYLGVTAEPSVQAYVSAVSVRWMVSAVARVYRPGCKADHCLVIEGPQGRRKSSAIQVVARKWFADELAELGSKDAALGTRGVWIVELAELDVLSRTESSRIKAFMSRSTDHFRPPYGRRVIDLPRQCVFAGTCNDSSYLKDATGGRRFWPLTCGRIDLEALRGDIDQLWAEARVLYETGTPWWLDSEELVQVASEQQADRYEGDAWDSLIANWADERLDAGHESISVPEVLELCIGKPKGTWTRADEMRVAHTLRYRRWERYRDRKRGMEWRYRPPVPKV